MATKKSTTSTSKKSAAPKGVEVNPNENGEATNGTTKQKSDAALQNTTSVPQNGDKEVQTLDVTDNAVAKRADEARNGDDVKFADESNPNQKSRDAGAPGEEFDQDGNPRTGGYSYGVSADDTTNTVPNEENKGTDPKDLQDRPDMQGNRADNNGDFVNPKEGESLNDTGFSDEDKFKLDDQLSVPAKGVAARVIGAAGNYLSVAFYLNNKILGTYTSMNGSADEAAAYRDEQLKLRDA